MSTWLCKSVIPSSTVTHICSGRFRGNATPDIVLGRQNAIELVSMAHGGTLHSLCIQPLFSNIRDVRTFEGIGLNGTCRRKVWCSIVCCYALQNRLLLPTILNPTAMLHCRWGRTKMWWPWFRTQACFRSCTTTSRCTGRLQPCAGSQQQEQSTSAAASHQASLLAVKLCTLQLFSPVFEFCSSGGPA